jgi:hypothetical protein
MKPSGKRKWDKAVVMHKQETVGEYDYKAGAALLREGCTLYLRRWGFAWHGNQGGLCEQAYKVTQVEYDALRPIIEDGTLTDVDLYCFRACAASRERALVGA